MSGLIGNCLLEMLWNQGQCYDGFCVPANDSFFRLFRPVTGYRSIYLLSG